MKHLLLSIFSFIFLSLAAIAVIGGYGIHIYLGEGPLREPKIILIDRGSGVTQIADQLQQEGIIAHSLIFQIAARWQGKSLKAGEYEFAPMIPAALVLQKIQAGEVYGRKITIPEGLTSWQVVQILNAREELSGTLSGIPPEGTLMPDTYHIVSGEDRSALIARMQQATQVALDSLWETRADNLPLANKTEVLILASLIEKETGVAAERERVAGVFINRLRRGMLLQTDPTVIYALTKGVHQTGGKGPLGRRLLRKDLAIEDPYNTYLYAGLPTGPIANPGIDSIRAALHPEDHEYIYFVADGTGGHLFAKTLEEHNRNVANWRKIRAAQ